MDNPKWKAVMIEKMEALQKNGTWELAELLEGNNTIGYKWAFIVKHKANGSMERFKASLVTKGSI